MPRGGTNKKFDPELWVLLAALLPGSCSVLYAPVIYLEIGSPGFGEVGLNILGFMLAVFFAWLLITKGRGREPKIYHNGYVVLLGYMAILVAGFFLLLFATILIGFKQAFGMLA